MNNATLKAALQDGLVTVIFKKKDGTERTMVCTTNFALIPKDQHPPEKPTPTTEDGLIAPLLPPKPETASRVFEPAINEWRSFRYDSVIRWMVDVLTVVA